MVNPIPWQGSITFPAVAPTAFGKHSMGAPSRLANLRRGRLLPPPATKLSTRCVKALSQWLAACLQPSPLLRARPSRKAGSPAWPVRL